MCGSARLPLLSDHKRPIPLGPTGGHLVQVSLYHGIDSLVVLVIFMCVWIIRFEY